MKSTSIRSLLLRLALASSLLLVPAISVGIYLDAQQSIAKTKASLRILALTMGHNTGRTLINVHHMLERLAGRPLVQAVDQHNCDPVLKDMKGLNASYANITYTNTQGLVVCSALPQPDGQLVDVSQSSWHQRLVANKDFMVGDPFFGPISQKWVSVLGLPIWSDQHKLVGGVEVALDLASFDPQIPDGLLPADSHYGFFNQDGILIWRNVKIEGFVGNRGQSLAAERIVGMKEGSFEAVSSDGINRFYSVVPMPETGWIAYVGVPAATIYAEARQRAATAIIMAIMVVGGVVTFSLLIARRITKSVANLEMAARLVKNGNLNVRIAAEGPRDIADVAHEFNAMLDARKRGEAQLQAIFDASPDALLITDTHGVITMANRRVEPLLGYNVKELIGQSVEILVPDYARSTHPRMRDHFYSAQDTQWMGNGREVKALCKDGREIDVEVGLSQIKSGPDVFIACAVRDVSERKKAEQALLASEAKLRSFYELSPLGLALTDMQGHYMEFNAAFLRITGYDADELKALDYWALTPRKYEADEAQQLESLRRNGYYGPYEKEYIRKDGHLVPLRLNGLLVKGSDGQDSIWSIVEDITESNRAKEHIQHLAFYDSLTQLPNRTLLHDRMHQAMNASLTSGCFGALLLIDLDNFKILNDIHGHKVGDLLLKWVAERLVHNVRAEDSVARLGGDEFVVLLESLSRSEADAVLQAQAIAELIQTDFRQTTRIQDIPFHCTLSIGVTMFRGHQANSGDLLKQADLAMYRAKEAGRNSIRFFESSMEVDVKRKAAMEADLRIAIQNNQFLLHYQPQVMGDGRLTGAEALLRWHHPERGMIPPLDFIPLAEETGLILPVGQWVMETACRQLAAWATQPSLAHLTLAVNVSAHQFRQPDFVAATVAAIEKSGANPQRLKLELTESLMADNLPDIVEKMVALKNLDVSFSLDDFGTGFSSLAYLKLLPLDQLKIDKSFVNDVLVDPNDAAIAQTIVALAQSLGLEVIAEGVETEDQQTFLANSGCHAYQGYYFSRPLPPEVFEHFVAQR